MAKRITDPSRRLARELERRTDVLYRTYLRPIGTRGLARVRLPGGTTKIVSDASGLTHKPGALVPVARRQADPAETIFGRPPAGKRGALPLLARSVTIDPSPAAGFTVHAYVLDGSTLTAYTMESGSPYAVTETRGSTTITAGELAQLSPITTDSRAIVGDGSLLAADLGEGGMIALYSWDVAGDVLNEYTVTGTRWASPAVYSAGYAWWAEWDQQTTGSGQTFRLMRADADLQNETQVTTATHANDVTTQDWELFRVVGVEGGSLVMAADWRDADNNEVTGSAEVDLPLDGSSGSAAADSTFPLASSPAIPLADGRAVCALDAGGISLLDGGAFSTIWGSSGIGTVYSVAGDGEVLSVYGATDGQPLIARDAVALASTPATSDNVDLIGGLQPLAAFPAGG